MKRKLSDTILIAVIISVLTVALFRTFFFAKSVNEYENRPANKLEAPTVQSIADGKFQQSTDKALSDQFPFSESFKKIYNTINSAYLKFITDPLKKSSQNKYMELMGMKLYDGEFFCTRIFSLDDDRQYFDISSANINSLINSMPETEFYGYYVEKDIDLDFETGERFGAYDYLKQKIDLSHFEKFSVQSFDTYKKNFYKTDHHWNSDGSYKAYTQLVNMLGVGAPLEIKDKKLVTDKFSGAYAKGKGISGYYENLYVNLFDYSPKSVYYKGEKQQSYGKSDTDFTYGGWYGIDTGEVIFENDNKDGQNLLVVGDSYDNAVIELLSSHFNKLCAIDPRYISDFNIKEYVKEHKIDKVLFIGCANFYFENQFDFGGAK